LGSNLFVDVVIDLRHLSSTCLTPV